MINDASGKIASLESKPEDAPVLPIAPAVVVPVPRTASAPQVFFEKYGEQCEPLSVAEQVAHGDVEQGLLVCERA